MSSATYSFRNALNSFATPTDGYYDSSTSLYLFQDGCLQDDGSQDCTASCQDRYKVFGSLDTLHNCMAYPTVADLYARGNLTDPSLLLHFNIEKTKVNSTLYNNITSTIKNCLIDMCTAAPGCTENLKAIDANGISSSPSNLNSTFYLQNQQQYGHSSYFDLCDYVPGSFNPDIGGIGVP